MGSRLEAMPDHLAVGTAPKSQMEPAPLRQAERGQNSSTTKLGGVQVQKYPKYLV